MTHNEGPGYCAGLVQAWSRNLAGKIAALLLEPSPRREDIRDLYWEAKRLAAMSSEGSVSAEARHDVMQLLSILRDAHVAAYKGVAWRIEQVRTPKGGRFVSHVPVPEDLTSRGTRTASAGLPSLGGRRR